MKKLLSFVLICTLVISMISLAGVSKVRAAQSVKDDIELNEGNYSEAFELNGIQFYYEDNDQYTITITKDHNSKQKTIAYKNKTNSQSNDIYYYESGKTESKNEPTNLDIDEISPLETADIKVLKDIKHKALNDEIKLEKYSTKDFAEVTHFTENESKNQLVANPNSVNKVYQALTNEYGNQYTNKYKTSLAHRGYTGYLYMHKTFSANPKTNFFFNAATTIGIVATALSPPASALLAIASWTAAGTAGYKLLKPTDFKEWNAAVHAQKEVKVGSVYPYRAFYDQHLSAVTATRGTAALSSVERKHRDSDYGSNTNLIRKGIDYYIRYHK